MKSQITQTKKLTLSETYPAVLAVAVVSVLVIVLIYFFTAFQSGIGSTVNQEVVNETGTINTAGYTLVNSSDCNFASPVITQVLNSTGKLVAAGNYTLTSDYRVVNTTSTTYTNALISYTYTNGGSTCSSISNTTTQFVGIVPLVGLILVIVLIGATIVILISSFVGGGKRA